MKTVVRAAAVLALLAGLGGASSAADAAPGAEGASQSLIVVDVVVRGTPPPGASIDVVVPDATFDDGFRQTVLLADAGAETDIVAEVGTVARHLFVDPDHDADAAAIAYSCEMVGNGTTPHPDSFCQVRTTPDAAAPVPHVYAEFWCNVNQSSNVTITLTFGTCAGAPVTTFVGAGDTPTTGSDVILGTTGADSINGLGGADRICGLGGNDMLNGGYGSDIVDGGFGADVVVGGQHPDAVYGGPGTDAVYGQEGADYLDGGTEADGCDGGTEHDLWANCEATANLP